MIHATAIIEKGAILGKDISVGAYCVVGAEVVLGDRVKLHSHVVISGKTTIGDDTQIFPFASIGFPPQDLKFRGEPSTLVIGKRNTIREYVTINPGTEGGGMITKIGDDCLIMGSVHIAHDCQIGNHVILVNNATLAGHVHVGDGAIIGGLSAVHQFVRIGHNAMIGGMSGVENDVIPYGLASSKRANLVGLNLVGLKRKGVEREEMQAMRQAFAALFEGEGTFAQRTQKVAAEYKDSKAVGEIIAFLNAASDRAVCMPE